MEYTSGNGNLVRIKDIADALGMKKTIVFNIIETRLDLFLFPLCQLVRYLL